MSIERNSHLKERAQSCFYCEKSITKRKRHIQNLHKDEPEILALSHLSANSDEKRHLIKHLLSLGRFLQNMRVMEARKGVIIVYVKKMPDCRVDELLPCAYCHRYITPRTYHKCYEHGRMPAFASMLRNSMSTMGRLLLAKLRSAAEMDKEFTMKVISQVGIDDVGMIAKSDPMILTLGEFYFKKLKKSLLQVNCSSRMNVHRDNLILSKLRTHIRIRTHLITPPPPSLRPKPPPPPP